MIPLVNKTNTIPPSATYPYGDMKDNPGDRSGNKVNRQFFDDYVQFFENIANNPAPDPIIVAAFAGAAATPNNLPDNATNGYQLINNLLAWVFAGIRSFIASQATVNAGTDDVQYVTSLTLAKNKPAITWIAPSFASGWANSGSTNPIGYVIYAGKVTLKGLITFSGSAGTDVLIFTLPTGYRPAFPYKFQVYFNQSANFTSFSANEFSTVTVNTDGTVTMMLIFTGYTSLTIDLSSISFFAA